MVKCDEFERWLVDPWTKLKALLSQARLVVWDRGNDLIPCLLSHFVFNLLIYDSLPLIRNGICKWLKCLILIRNEYSSLEIIQNDISLIWKRVTGKIVQKHRQKNCHVERPCLVVVGPMQLRMDALIYTDLIRQSVFISCLGGGLLKGPMTERPFNYFLGINVTSAQR